MKSYVCPRCNKQLASRQSLWKHKRICKRQPDTHHHQDGYIRNTEVGNGLTFPTRQPTFQSGKRSSSYELPTPPPKNLKIEALVNEIIDNSSTKSNQSIPNIESIHVENVPETSKEVVHLLKKGKDRNVNADADEQSLDKETVDKTDEIVIPDTVEGLRERFNELFVEFTREKKHNHRHELTLLLDEMLRHEAITALEYTQLNSLVAENLPERASDEEDENEDMNEEDYEKSTFDYVIQHDREELFELLEELKEDQESTDEVLNIEELIGSFLENEFLEGNPTKKMVEEAIAKLQSPNILKSQKHRLKMLLDDISENRYRIQSIFTRLSDAEDKQQLLSILKYLKQEKLLSDEQFEQLSVLEEPDVPTIAAVIKETKIGQGVKFLPRTINMLRESMHSLLAELEEKGSALIKDKLTGVLAELRRRQAISETGYNSIKDAL